MTLIGRSLLLTLTLTYLTRSQYVLRVVIELRTAEFLVISERILAEILSLIGLLLIILSIFILVVLASFYLILFILIILLILKLAIFLLLILIFNIEFLQLL